MNLDDFEPGVIEVETPSGLFRAEMEYETIPELEQIVRDAVHDGYVITFA